MGRTAGMWSQDTAFPDGQIFIPASDAFVGAGAMVLSRAGSGLIQGALANSQTVTLDFILSKAILRYGMQDDEQQSFGSASGTGQNAGATPPNTFATNWQQSGRPPYTQAQNQVVPTNRPKGIQINSLIPVYKVSTLDLTSVSIGLTKTVFANGIAPVVTNLLAAGANGQPTAVSAQPNAIASVIAGATMSIDYLTELIAELTLVLPATSTAIVYGMFMNVSFNHN